MSVENEKKTGDILGIAPYGEALKVSVEKGFAGAEALLSRICLPAAEEFGLMLRDKVSYWRLNNIIKITNKASGKIEFKEGRLELTAHPRVVKEIMDSGSWCDDNNIQEMWAGLLASSCNKSYGDDINLLFANTLKQLTSNQAKILNYLCESCKMRVDKNDLVMAEHLELPIEELRRVIEIESIHRLDCELDHLRNIDLLSNDEWGLSSDAHGAGLVFGQDDIVAHLEPSPFAIALYVKSKGAICSPKEYFKLEYREADLEE